MQNAKCKVQNEGGTWRALLSLCTLHFALCTLQCSGLRAEPTAAQVIGGDLTKLVTWGAPAEARRGPLVLLADGGLLAADVLGSDDERLTGDSAGADRRHRVLSAAGPGAARRAARPLAIPCRPNRSADPGQRRRGLRRDPVDWPQGDRAQRGLRHAEAGDRPTRGAGLRSFA